MINSSIITKITLSLSSVVAFVSTYFFQLTVTNGEQFLSVAAVLLLDGFFGVIAGTKREGFKTFKALKVVNDLKFKIRNKVLVETHLVVNEGKNGRNPQFRLANEKRTLVVRLNKKKKSFSNVTESRKTIF